MYEYSFIDIDLSGNVCNGAMHGALHLSGNVRNGL